MVCGYRDRNGRIDARQLLDADRVRQRVGPGASVFLGDRHPHQPELGKLADDLVREPLLAVELLGDRCDPLECEPANRLADELVLGLEVEVHGEARLWASSTISRTPYPVPPSSSM